MNYANIKYCDIADGVGVRTTLFVSGCSHHCKGCFQPETWDFAAGEPFTEEVAQQIIDSLAPTYIDGLTLLGGEPMEPENQGPLADLCERAKAAYPDKSIWCYTGDCYEDLIPGGSRHTEDTDRLLACIDVLVDGPFIEDQKDITLRFCGSANQRLIDLNATRAAGEVVFWTDDPVFSTHTM
ncbi:MAG: anaerobic ribonucleoside-triphosphate reductase activating protein [Eggerthellaceae bacterium]|jgi:anaerobic ribonucleoside-triphosphate reductase activating protein